MNRVFRSLPLPVKLLLIGFIPLALLVYTSLQIYADKKSKVKLLSSYIERIQQSGNINTLIDYLEKERKYSFDYAKTKGEGTELMRQRPRTDSAIEVLETGGMPGFKNYTFLEKLADVRKYVDSGYLPPDQVMHYYTTSIFRINTLNTVSHGSEIYLQPIHKDLVGQKLLSEMITNLGIMRSNIYNVLYTKKYMVETLVGMIGVHDVYKTYETEFLLKASPAAIESYNKVLGNYSLASTLAYIDTLFKRFKPDSSYSAGNWWRVSNDGMDQLTNLRRSLWNNVVTGTNSILKAERTAMRNTLVFLILGLLFVVGILVYIIFGITRSLTEMNLAAQRISEGGSSPSILTDSRDVIGSLARSITRIETTNKLLADAADAIGKGNFDVPVKPRGKDDILGNAIARMKDNLLQNMHVITESNEQLHQSAEKYKTIFYKSPLPKWIYDVETLQFLDVNDTAIRHYGYTREEFLAMTIKEVRPQEDYEMFLRHMEEVKSDPGTNVKYWRHVKKNGENITVEVTAHMIDYNSRKARMAVMMDITEKIKAEEKLAASEQRFRSIIEQFPYPVINYEPDGTCIAANEAWELMWQDKRENVKGYNIRKDPQMIASGLSRFVEKAFEGELSISEPYLYDPALIGQKGRKRWMVMTLYPLKSPGGQLLEVVLILQDITDSKNAQEILRVSEEKRRLIMNAALDAIMMIDTQGLITFWNPQAETMFGWKENEIKGKRLSDTIIPHKYGERDEKGMKHYLQTGEDAVLNKLVEITALNRDGKEFPVELSIIPVEQGDEKSFCVFIRDISARKKAEENLKQSHEELRQLTSHLQNIREEERTSMAREVHDELGQQITCIKMDVSWLLKRIKTEDALEKEKIREIPELLDHTSRTVRKIATELRPSILDDFGLIEALEWHSGEFQKRSGIKIQFHSEVPEINIGQTISTSLFRIYQESLTNVVRHANATEITGSISLKESKLILTVSDNGKGFDVTSIGHKKTLGLLGIRERTLMMGGNYGIASMPGKGTTITVTVPLKVQEETY
ncbi:MAG: PAS domain S-box protein [Chitinophagales bacterium]